MKPNSKISRQPGRLDADSSASRLRSNHPETDYSFQAPASELRARGSGSSHKLRRPTFAPGFRDLSNQFLGAETKRNYVAEVFFFAIIVAVSAWPIASMVQALSQLAK
jgi:hypothetical protein